MNRRYRHECRKCVQLGQHEIYDLYYCPEHTMKMPCLVARCGTDKCDVRVLLLKTLAGGMHMGPALAKAYRLYAERMRVS